MNPVNVFGQHLRHAQDKKKRRKLLGDSQKDSNICPERVARAERGRHDILFSGLNEIFAPAKFLMSIALCSLHTRNLCHASSAFDLFGIAHEQ